MGKTILTPQQLKFLGFIQNEPQITKRFYLTGGTALSEFYLQHRVSEDIDLFTEKEEVDQRLVDVFLRKASPVLLIAKINKSQFLGLVSYELTFKNEEKLKVDFSYYPFPRIHKDKKHKNLEIDSIWDIATNKLHTLFMQPRARDYIDLYFVMRKYHYSLNKLIMDAKAKFDWDIDRLTLASQLARAKDFQEVPRMLVPFNRKGMEKFFLSLAKKLEKEILK